MLDVMDDGYVLAGVGLFMNVLVAELAISEEPLTGTESFVVVMTFTDDVVIVVGDVVVMLVVVVVGLAIQIQN